MRVGVDSNEPPITRLTHRLGRHPWRSAELAALYTSHRNSFPYTLLTRSLGQAPAHCPQNITLTKELRNMWKFANNHDPLSMHIRATP